MSFSFSQQQWNDLFRLGYPGEWDKSSLASEAIYRGGEALVKQKLTKNVYLPFNIEEIIDEGMKNLGEQMIHLHTAKEVEEKINVALREGKGFSVIRLGDGELLALSHDTLVSSEEIKQSGKLQYALGGFSVPNHLKRDQLVKNLLEADVVGIPEARYPTYQRLFNQLAKVYKLPLQKMALTNSQINYRINEETTCFHQLLMNYRVLLIGNRAHEGKEFFEKQGYNSVVGSIPVPGIESVEQVLSEAEKFTFDVAFVSAGIPANIICVELAKRNKVAIDFGHLLDRYVKGHWIIKK